MGKFVGFKLDKGWQQFANCTDPHKFKRIFAQQRKQALTAIARQVVQKSVDNYEQFEKNADLTRWIKGHPMVLHHRRRMIKAIRTKVVMNGAGVLIHIPESHRNYAGYYMVHEGGSIPVTPRMRAMWKRLWLTSKKKHRVKDLSGRARAIWRMSKNRDFKPLSKSTTEIVIPARPFFDKTFQSRWVRMMTLAKMQMAVHWTFERLKWGR